MRTLRIIGSLLVLLTALSFVFTTPPAAQADTRTTVTPSVGEPGTRFMFYANGFSSRERVSFWLNMPNGQVMEPFIREEHRANSSGDIVWSWDSPRDAQAGTWQMVVHGRSGAEYVINFTIGSVDQPDPGQPYGVEPAQANPGSIFRFFAVGFAPGEYVHMSAYGPLADSDTKGFQANQIASPEGRIDGSWTAPNAANTGEWYIVLRGNDSGLERTIPVSIVPRSQSSGPNMVISPSVGRAGMRFAISATGFFGNEEMRVWVNRPDGTVVETKVEGSMKSAPDGRIAWTWVAPADAQTGHWEIVAYGMSSERQTLVGFDIIP
jgi:hypothetical protein